MILFDKETKVDLLNNEPIAASMVGRYEASPLSRRQSGSWRLGRRKIERPQDD